MFNVTELQAVVLAAGVGSRMYPVTDSTPKGLVPVGNKPLIWYTLNNLAKEGFKDLIVLVRDTDVQLRHFLLENCELNLTVATIKSSSDDYTGTAEALRTIKDKIKMDFMLVSCDLVGDVNLRNVMDVHRLRDADLTCVFSTLPEAELTGKKSDTDSDSFFIGTDDKEGRLLYYAAAADLEEELTFMKSLLHRYPRIRIHADYLDTHVYVMKRWILDFLAERKSIVSVREELVPMLVRRQFRQHRAISDNPGDLFKFVPKDGHTLSKEDTLRCYSYFEPGMCHRVNSLARFVDVNRNITSIPVLDGVPRIGEDATIGKTQVSKDSLVGSSCRIGDRCSVKKSIIGNHCSIASNVKLSNCVIMDHVRIEEGANLVNTVVCKNAYISANVDLKDCQVAASFTVEPGFQAKHECLSNRGLL